jgi:plastocyanin
VLGRVSLFAQITSAVLSAVGGVVLQLLVGHGIPLLIVAALFVAGVWITALGFRWGPLPGAIISAAYLVFLLVGNPYPIYHLGHPKDLFVVFIAIILLFGLATLTFGVCLAATIQNYRDRERRTPTWLAPALGVLGGAVLGAILIGALAQPVSTAAATTIGGVPAVHLGPGNFDQSSITIPVGSKLILADDAGVPHVFNYGMWSGNQQHAETPAGAPALKNLRVDSGNVELGPFTTAGTYHIYCVIHPGMNLTVVVQ